jgi:hypothetical protein
MQIVDETREKPEERFLLEIRALFFMEIGKDKDEDR